MSPDSPAQHPAGGARREDEAALARRAQAGDRAAFGALVERYAGQARRVARAVLGDPDDADDAAQDAFLSALVKLDRFDTTRPFGPWLMRIVANAAADRRRRRRVRRTEELAPGLAARGLQPDAAAVTAEFDARLRAALADLPERQRVAVVLFDVEGYGHKEIAGILGIPEGTARSDVFHARRFLRDRLAAWKEES